MLREEEYRRIRERAAVEVARSLVRDPPRDGSGGGLAARDATGDAAGPGVALAPAVRAWLKEHFDDAFDDALGDDVDRIEEFADVDPESPDASGVDPLREGAEGEAERRRLYAYHVFRADLLAALEPHAGDLARAVEVHDALERLVGERGPPTDRRPREVVDAFVEWAAGRGPDASRDAGAFTVLHVMRIATLDPLGGNVPEGLPATVREWLSEAHPGIFEGPDVAVEG